MARPKRTPIPLDLAARALFQADRTCCVCRDASKPVQIHHIDGDRNNNVPENLGVLCFDCHRETQITGGFDRKLDADQVILYREDWQSVVASTRQPDPPSQAPVPAGGEANAALATSIVEILRDRGDIRNLAFHYSRIGNVELRDKYIEEILSKTSDPREQFLWRGMQGRLDELPSELIDEQLARYEEHDLSSYASYLVALRRYEDAARAYARVIARAVEEDLPFSAAFYIRVLASSGLAEELFLISLAKAIEEDDLWWQMRPLQELGWGTELDRFFRENADRIDDGDSETLKALKAESEGRLHDSLEHRKAAVRRCEPPYMLTPFPPDAIQNDSGATSPNGGKDSE